VYNKILHKYEFKQAPWVQLLKKSPKNLVCNFGAFLQFSMNSRSLLIFLGLNKSENKFLIHTKCQAQSGPGLQPTGRGGLPHAADRQAGWASAWRPGPAEEVARGTGTGRARQRGGALTGSSMVAGRRQGTTGELTGAIGRASGKAVGGGAHPNGGALWRRWRSLVTEAFISGERAPVAGGDGGTSLQCRCGRGKVRAASIGTTVADGRVSP
jgi:hypothetical protein